MAPILELARERGLHVVEDAAGALGSRSGGRPAGASGDLACFSLHPRKVVTTGEGGAVTTDDEGLARRVRRLRHHGIEDGEFPEVGLNYRHARHPRRHRAAAARAAGGDRRGPRRRRRPLRRGARASSTAWSPRRGRTGEGDRHSYQAYIARAPDRATRDRLIAGLREHGVEAQIGTYHVPGIAAYRARGYDASATPVARDAADRGLALPLYESLREDEQDRVIAALADVLARRPVGARG